MKLFIQIPCYNEEKTLPAVISDIRKVDFSAELPGTDVELLVIDDGSKDRTVDVARELGVRHIVRHGRNRGLAAAFRSGVDYALEHGADVLVNTDGDNQYCAADIPLLVRPVLSGEAEFVVGCRPIREHKEFSPLKKLLQYLGSWTLRQISQTTVRDAASGFRAFSRETCMRMFIYSKFSYCMETLIQAGNSGTLIRSVDIRVNGKTRESRLFKNIWQYVRKSGGTMLMMFVLFRPGRFFFLLSLPFWAAALFVGIRAICLVHFTGALFKEFLSSYFLLLFFAQTATLLCALALIGELLRAQRRISEESLYRQKEEALRRLAPENPRDDR